MSRDTLTVTSTDSSPPSMAALEQALPWLLTVIESPDADAVGRFIELPSPPSGGAFAIGRVGGDGLALALGDGQLSRRHAIVSAAPRGWAIRDAGSKNGTFVDGSQIPAATALRPGAVVRLGASFLLYERAPLVRPTSAPDPVLIGNSFAQRAVLDSVRTVARTELPVMLLGETGTGKELTAARIHAESGRTGPLVAINCAAIPVTLAESHLFGHRRGAFTGATRDAEGHFKAAAEGTLFLDEVGELALDLQAKLLRVLEVGEFTPVGATTPERADVRVIAATNVDLRRAAAEGTFRMDLYARLAGYPIVLPPLRERRRDIPLLLRAFIARVAPSWRGEVDPALIEALLLHAWPMNVRELLTITQRLLLGRAAASRLELVHLPRDLLAAMVPQAASPGGREVDASEPPTRESLAALLAETGGNVARVAQRLGKDRTQIYRWLDRHDLRPDDYRG